MSYKTKAQRDANQKNLNVRIELLLRTFADYIIKLRGAGEPVTDKELKDFVDKLPKK